MLDNDISGNGMKMHLVKTHANPLNGLPQMTTQDDADQPMFRHCAGGAMAVTVPHLFDDLLPVFKAHGVEVTFDSDFVLSSDLTAVSRDR